MSKEKKLEDLLNRLQEISALLEEEETTLDESIALYEEAQKISSLCKKKLEEAEQKIIVIEKQMIDKNALS